MLFKGCIIREVIGKAYKGFVREIGIKRRVGVIFREFLKVTLLKKYNVEEDYGEYFSEIEDEEFV